SRARCGSGATVDVGTGEVRTTVRKRSAPSRSRAVERPDATLEPVQILQRGGTVSRDLGHAPIGHGTEAKLRPLALSDADDVLTAFRSSEDVARQGNVTSIQEAREYVEALTDPAGPHRPWAIVLDNTVLGLVCVTVDEENRNGWFFYWMALEGRGRGWVK